MNTVSLATAVADLGDNFKTAIAALKKYKVRVSTKGTCGNPGRCLLAAYFTKRTGLPVKVRSWSVRAVHNFGTPAERPGSTQGVDYFSINGPYEVAVVFDDKRFGRKQKDAMGRYIPTTLLNRSGKRCAVAA